MYWYTKWLLGSAADIAAATAGQPNAMPPQPIDALLAAKLKLLDLNISAVLATPKQATSIRTLTPMATPAGCTELSERDGRAILGDWA